MGDDPTSVLNMSCDAARMIDQQSLQQSTFAGNMQTLEVDEAQLHEDREIRIADMLAESKDFKNALGDVSFKQKSDRDSEIDALNYMSKKTAYFEAQKRGSVTSKNANGPPKERDLEPMKEIYGAGARSPMRRTSTVKKARKQLGISPTKAVQKKFGEVQETTTISPNATSPFKQHRASLGRDDADATVVGGFNAGDFGLRSEEVSDSKSDESVPELNLADLRKMKTGRKTDFEGDDNDTAPKHVYPANISPSV